MVPSTVSAAQWAAMLHTPPVLACSGDPQKSHSEVATRYTKKHIVKEALGGTAAAQ